MEMCKIKTSSKEFAASAVTREIKMERLSQIEDNRIEINDALLN